MVKAPASLWGSPPTRFYDLLRRAEQSIHRSPLTVAIIGCSDGKFVLPTARRGHQVIAMDVDEIALYGGTKIGPVGDMHMPGLVARLKAEYLEDRVQVICGDIGISAGQAECDLVFTSGAIQYSRNLGSSAGTIICNLKSYARPDLSFFYADYMLPMDDTQAARWNFFSRVEWAGFFSVDRWNVLHNRVLPPQFHAAHVDLPVDHYHHWGHILARQAAQ